MKVKSDLQTPRFDPVDRRPLSCLKSCHLTQNNEEAISNEGWLRHFYSYQFRNFFGSGKRWLSHVNPVHPFFSPAYTTKKCLYYCCVTWLMCLYKYLVLFLLLIEGNVPVHVQHKNIQGNGSLLITFHYALKNVNNVILTILIREHWDLARTTARTNSTTWTIAFELILYVDFSGWIIHTPFSAVFCNQQTSTLYVQTESKEKPC